MIQKRSCNLSTKVNRNFCDIVKIRLTMADNVNIFTICESLLQKVIKILQIIYQNKSKVPGKMSKFWV